jgi:para-nitrobenzyl esterase
MRIHCGAALVVVVVACGVRVAVPEAAPDGAVGSACDPGAIEGDGIVRTESGAVRGARVGRFFSFKGIPYASPPEGALRWRPPALPACWEGTRPATGYGYVCMQPATSDPSSTPVGSEDCLTLNVWTPEARRGANRPVLVYVHGGYFTWGSSSRRVQGVDLYDGAELATRGDVVVVTVNYRLGALGFAGHARLGEENEHGASGNYGLLDQIAALSWVKRNVQGFGGDPDRVILFGLSAGAISTAALYASPLARGLFSGAILHSGSPGARPLEHAESLGATLASRLDCDREPDVVACLRERSAAEIVAALPESFDGDGFGPVVDGWVLPEPPLELVHAGAGSPVPLIVGVTADEFTTMISNFIDGPIDSPEAYATYLRDRFGEAAAADILAHWPASGYSTPIDALVAFFSDLAFVCPSRRLAGAAAGHAPVGRFVYTHTYSSGPQAIYRAGHGLDLPFVFRNFFGHSPDAAELRLSDTVIAAWSRFAATGELPSQLPPYDPVTDPHLILDTILGTGARFRGETCDFLDSQVGM